MRDAKRILAGFSGNPMVYFHLGGEQNMDHLLGRKSIGNSMVVIGGSTFNIAATIERLGGDRGIECKALVNVGQGRGELRSMLAECVAERGLNCQFLPVLQDTNIAVAIRESSGRTTLLGDKHAYVKLPIDEVRAATLEHHPDVTIASGITGDDLPLAEDMFRFSPEGCVKILTARRELFRNYHAALLNIMRMTSILIVNEDEAQTLVGYGCEEERMFQTIHELGPDEVIVTRGGNGAVYSHRCGDRFAQPAVNAGPVKDTNGAGDSFTGAWTVARHCEGRTVPEALQFAAATAGLKISFGGALYPDRGHVDDILANKRG